MDTELGKALRARREELGLSQRAVGEIFGVPQQTIDKWERGLIQRPRGQIDAIAQFLERDRRDVLLLYGIAPDGHAELSERIEAMEKHLRRMQRDVRELTKIVQGATQQPEGRARRRPQ